jgi:hypothetical protein
MSVQLRRALVALLASQVLVAIVATGAYSSGGPLAGHWSGHMNPRPGSKVRGHRLWLFVDASERGGSWRISTSCRGPLRLQNISNGYHHYVEGLAPGATCLGGGIDCIKRIGAGLYDTFQSHAGSEYDSDGTLRRVAG